jgi:iron complex transport system ATP-binding protein
MEALTADNISFGYDPHHPVVRDVNLTILRGEFFTLVGPNGSGKSTLLRLLDRFLIPQRGTLSLFGEPLSRYTRDALSRQVALVPQDNSVQFPFTVEEIVLMGRSPHARGRIFENRHDRETARAMMQLMDIESLAGHAVSDLSGGERQRVFIARALAQQPQVILLDEPNAHLDIAHQVEVYDVLRKLHRESGLTVVSVSHDLNLAASASDRIAMMDHGALAAVGTPANVLTAERIAGIFRLPVIVDKHPKSGNPRVSLPA